MGKFVESTLSENETVKYYAKVSLWSFWWLIMLGIFTITFGVGLIFFLIVYLRWSTTELAITDRKVIAKYGIISRSTIEILLPKIESVHIDQGVFGRILNYGTVVISGAGRPQAPIAGIVDPLAFRRRFMEVQEEATR